MEEKRRCSASVRTVVEYALLAGDLTPGSQLARMREGTLGHKARQAALAVEGAQAEVSVRGTVEGDIAVLEVGGRIDALYERAGVTVVEEIKLAPPGDPPVEALEVHKAQAVCYGHLLCAGEAIIRVLYVRVDGTEVAAFEERMDAEAMQAAFVRLVTPFLHRAQDRLLWMDARDASIERLAFPFGGYRAGQREMAVQAYWAIRSRKRLFAQAPTGTGKTLAALYPALKALAAGLTGQLFYLTARTTAQQNADQALSQLRGAGLRARVLCMTAREKLCPREAWGVGEAGVPADSAAPGEDPSVTVDSDEESSRPPTPFRCDVLHCPRAIGFFDRLGDALCDMRRRDDWSRAAVEAVARAHCVCPFEFALALCEEADVVIGDYNYAFDPGARIRRIFMWNTNLTLLVDEAHNLPDRARAMLSAPLDSRQLRQIRRDIGKAAGRRAPLYRALTPLIALLEQQPEGTVPAPPAELRPLLEACMEALAATVGHVPVGDLPRTLVAALSTLERFDDTYAVLREPQGKPGKTGRPMLLTLMNLDPAPHLIESTRKLRGTVYFSATLTPLPAWRDVIGGTEEDGLIALPSPFPQENLLVLRCPLATKYRARAQTADAVAGAIEAVAAAHPGNYLACFPSYAYLRLVRDALIARGAPLALHVQTGGMNDAARAAYLAAFAPRTEGAMVGMVVLGGIFGEGIDLPGDRLCGVMIVGVGLPQIGPEREALRAYYDGQSGSGFAQAYRYPGMNKVLQAVGRVIRTETDRGVALLIDDRFLQHDYACLMPPWWHPAQVVRDENALKSRLQTFWNHF